MNAADEPLHGASIDEAATELGHPRLPNAIVGRYHIVTVGPERADDLRGELAT